MTLKNKLPLENKSWDFLMKSKAFQGKWHKEP